MRLTDAEWTVMNALWNRAPASARDILEAVEVETGWAYTTVKTLLSRLATKGAVQSRRRANTILFEARITREQARRSAVRSLLEKAFDGAFGSLVQHMVTQERLSRSEREKLAAMLREADREERR